MRAGFGPVVVRCARRCGVIHYMTSEGLGSPWVGNEIRIVSKAGVPIVLHCMRTPAKIHFDADWAKQMQGSAKALYPLPIGSLIASNIAAPFVFGTRWLGALMNALCGERESVRARVACLSHFFVACMWAMNIRKQAVTHIHAQWAFSSASIAMYGAWLLGKPFSFTGHAVDLTKQRVALRDKIRRAKFIVAISEWHKRFYLEQDRGATSDLAEKIHVAYCGIYTDEMVPRGEALPQIAPISQSRDRWHERPFTILSAGRLIGKKGFPYVIEACKVLKDRGVDFRCIIAGSGPDEAMLRAMIEKLGVGDRVEMTGKALQQEKIPAFMHTGDVFTLACVWADDGDVDGLPQLTMEAMGCGLPAVTTRLVGNPDLVIHEKTGLLVEPNDAKGLADALERLAKDRELAARLAVAGRKHVLDVFDITRSLEPLISRYREALDRTRNAKKTQTHATRAEEKTA
jgi:colanic acid/amylovoran biosynthesis glycosyltransferase